MTKQLKNWKLRLILWLENRREKEIKTEIERNKETILYNLLENKSTEQSIEMFSDISEQFINLMAQRLEKVSEEKSVLERFLS
jgi:adenine-specific DNA methylase